MTNVEQWRIDAGYTYRQLAELLGCSHQYTRNLCLHGTAASVKLIKLITISKGVLKIEDFLAEEDRAELQKQGFVLEDDELLV